MEQDTPYLTPEQVARTFIVPVNRVHFWLREGRLQGVKIGRTWRIPKSAIEGFLATGAKAASE